MSFHPAEEVAQHVRAHVKTFQEEFGHLKDALIPCLFAEDEVELRLQGKSKSAVVIQPQAMGSIANRLIEWALRGQVGEYDALLVVQEWHWRGMAEDQRIALVYHELCHLRQKTTPKGKPVFSKESGRPVIETIGHDIEEFEAVVERFGAWHEGLERFRQILNGRPARAEGEAAHDG